MQGGRFFLPHDVGPRVPVPPGGDLFEVVSVRGEAFDVPLTLEEGVWAPVALSGRRVLAARLRAQRPPLESGLRPTGDLARLDAASAGPRPALPVSGTLAWRSFSIGDLLRPVSSVRGEAFRIYPSNYCPVELPPLPEPQAAMTAESLPWALERTVVPPPSDEEHRPIRLRSQRLAVRTDDAGAAAVERVLAELRATRLRTTEVQTSVVTLPLGSFPEAWSDPDAAAAGGVAVLLARPGARLVETARLVLRDGQRAAVVSSTDRWYLKDYDVELACTTTIGNPVLGRLPTGLSVDVCVDPLSSSPHVSLLVRFDRGVLRELRSISTRYGPIQAPSMHEASCHGAVTLAPGETRLFGFSASGPEATLVLLSLGK